MITAASGFWEFAESVAGCVLVGYITWLWFR